MGEEPGAHSGKTKRHSKGVRGEEVGRSVPGTGMVGWSDGITWIGTEPGMVGSGGGVIPLPTGHYHTFEGVSCLIRALLRPLASSKPKKGTKNQNTRRRTRKRGKGAPAAQRAGGRGAFGGPGRPWHAPVTGHILGNDVVLTGRQHLRNNIEEKNGKPPHLRRRGNRIQRTGSP